MSRSPRSAATCASWACSRRRAATSPRGEEVSRAQGDFAAIARFVREVKPAGASLTVVKTSVGAAGSVAVAIDKAEWPEVVGTISGDDTIFIATQDARRPAAPGRAPPFPVPDLTTMSKNPNAGAQAHRARLFRRPGHLLPGALGRGEHRPPGHHRHGRYRRHRCRRGADAAGARARAGRDRAPPGGRACRLLRAGAALPDHGQRAPRPDVPAVRRRRARDAGADHRARRARAGHQHDRARLHGRRQRPGAL